MPCHQGPHGEALGQSGGRGSKGDMGIRAFTVVFARREDEAGSSGSALDNSDSFRGTPGHRTVPSCLVPGPGVVRAEE